MQIHKDFDLSKILWYGIGGVAKYVIDVSSRADVEKALKFIEENNIEKHIVIGLGSNLLFSDEPYHGAVIRFMPSKAEGSIDVLDDGLVYAYAGQVLDDVVQFCLRNNLVGLEWAGGLPGTVGAAVRGNVGAFGREIKDVVEEIEILNKSDGAWRIEKLTNPELEFSYRNSFVKKNKNVFVVSTLFNLKSVGRSLTEEAKKTYFKNIEYRAKHHPLEYPNCGSVFKNIVKKEEIEAVLSVFPEFSEDVEKKWHGKVSMGAVIGKLGLAGLKVGNAQISHKHNNYIVNLGGATFMDVLTIIRKIQQEVGDTFGLVPEVEIEIVE